MKRPWKFVSTKIILRYLSETKRKLKIPLDHHALLLFDNFKGQCTEKLLKLLDSHNIDVVLIPPNCTDRLQPLDLVLTKQQKSSCKKIPKLICNWSSPHLDGKLERKAIDLQLIVMKPLGVKWVIELYNYLKGKPDIIMNGFREAGILDCVKVWCTYS